MRITVVAALVLLSACASDRLALAPPAGVDLSGQWRLNVEDSDDPLHLIQSQTADPSKTGPGSQGGQGGQGGQGRGGRGRQGGAGGFGGPGAAAPSVPALGALGEGLRWPGKDIDIKQVAGVVAMTSVGLNQVYQPTTGDRKHRPHHPRPDDDAHGRDRDMPARDRDGPPARCGWDDKTLVIEAAESDDDHPPFEKRYSISGDGQRLIEVVGFKGGRSGGFTMSRVWDRVAPNASVNAAPSSGKPAAGPSATP